MQLERPSVEPYLTTNDLTRVLRLSKPSVLRLLHSDDPDERLPSIRAGIKILVSPDALREWTERRETTSRNRARVEAGRKRQRRRRA